MKHLICRIHRNSGSIFLVAVFSLGVIGLSSNTIEAADCNFKIIGGDTLQFDLKEIRVPKSCDVITVTVINGGKMPVTAMGHNFALAKVSDWNALALSEAKRFPKSATDISKDKRLIATTTFVGGAPGDPKEASVQIKRSSLDPKQEYQFFCSFPGHFATMNGKFILEK